MSKLGTKNKPVRVRVQTEERAMEIFTVCNENDWQVIVGIEPDKREDISDFDKMVNASVPKPLSAIISKNAPCLCGSGKQYKRCCGK